MAIARYLAVGWKMAVYAQAQAEEGGVCTHTQGKVRVADLLGLGAEWQLAAASLRLVVTGVGNQRLRARAREGGGLLCVLHRAQYARLSCFGRGLPGDDLEQVRAWWGPCVCLGVGVSLGTH